MAIEHHEQVVADCPQCGKRDFIEQDDNKWVCLNCGHSKDLSEKSTEAGLGRFFIAAWIVGLIVFALLAGFV